MDKYSSPYTSLYGSSKKKKRHTGCVVALLIVVAVVLTLALTCPSAPQHKEMIATTVSSAVSNIATEKYGLLGTMGSMLAAGAVSTTISDLVDVHDYVVCSVGILRYDDKDVVVSVGLLHHVYTVNSSVLEQKLRDITDSLPPLAD